MPDAGRVITGTAKGVVLRGPGEGTRALSDRVKQALFATLESELGDVWPVSLLDLFAGSGAVGIEALSRGAPRVVFVERSPDAARVIAENLRRARVGGGEIVRGDALRYLERGFANGTAAPGTAAGGPAGNTAAATRGPATAFGIAMIDPPYADTTAMEAALVQLGDPSRGWLRDDAVVVAKHFWRDAPPERVGDLLRNRVRRFGETALSFYRRAVDAPRGDPP
jgi:16S rRNA (guanine966-N2)-methyltransferase